MGGFRIPGPQCDPDSSIEDGTLTRAKSSTPGHVCASNLDPPSKDSITTLSAPVVPTITICVFYFGGFQSSDTDMGSWLKSAQKQRSDVKFHAYPYPAHAKAEPSEKDINTFKSVIRTIDETDAESIFIVGHSSGCAIANGVHSRLKDITKVSLVALDGFAPSAAQLKWKSTQVWAAVNGSAKSFNHDRLSNRVGKRLQIFHAPHTDCTTELALHFSLVNVSANDKELTNFRTDLGNGYNNCEANLCYL
jgi:hypothetical protein